MNEYDEQLAGLDEAARRAGAIITERIEELVSTAERRAGEIHQHAEANAETVHQQTIESAQRVCIGMLSCEIGISVTPSPKFDLYSSRYFDIWIVQPREKSAG